MIKDKTACRWLPNSNFAPKIIVSSVVYMKEKNIIDWVGMFIVRL